MSVNYTPPPQAPYIVAPPVTPPDNNRSAERAASQAADDSDSDNDNNKDDNSTNAPAPEKFMDIVFARLSAAVQAQTKIATASVAKTTTSAAATAQSATAAAAGQNAAPGLSASAFPALDTAATQKLTELMNHLLAGLPADQKNAAVAALQAGGSPQQISSALIAAGLTPDQLAKIVDELKKKEESGAEDVMAGAVQVVPVPVQRTPIFTTGGSAAIQLPTKTAPAQKGSGDVPDLAAQLNPLTADSNGDTTTGTQVAGAGSNGFDNVLKMFEHAQQAATPTASTTPHPGSTTTPTATTGGSATPATAGTPPSPGLSTVPGTNAAPGDISFDDSLTGQVYPDGLDWSQKNGGIGAAGAAAGLTVTGNAVLTSLVSNAAQAITPHPTTQIVATALVKGAADGQSKDITLRMDPPELGKVEVKMTIDKDAGVRTHIVVEKPETYMMLQRDSHVLQQALRDSGLDVSGNSLSFEMAKDGSQFSQGNNSGGNNGGGGSSAGGSGANNILETTMDWQVNPDTGQTQYNIWA